MGEARKRWYQSRKLWGTILAALVRLYAPRFGFDADAAEASALLIMGGVGSEAVIDAVSAFARDYKRAPEGK